jgi:hypothetical protein
MKRTREGERESLDLGFSVFLLFFAQTKPVTYPFSFKMPSGL